MTVYLGTFGQVELKRQFDGSQLKTVVTSSDVDVTEKRIGLDFEHGQLLTGDEIEITGTVNLTFIDSYTKKKAKKFVHVDELGGVRLFDTFAHAMGGVKANAVALAAPSSSISVDIVVSNTDYRILGRVQSYELNTTRETVDTTTLSDEFRSQISTVMSGSGRMSCEWEYTGDTANELPMYLFELAHRTKVGSNFSGQFYIKKSGYNPSGVAARNDDEVWWNVEGIITAAAIQFSPDSTVQITADFITTGEIQLRMKLETPDALLQEDSGDIRLDQDSGAKLLLQQEL
jgi:hypothetical protein